MALETNTIHCTDALTGLKTLPDESVDCVVTSPPYWSLRDYGEKCAVTWDGKPDCKHTWQRANKGKTLSCTACGAWRGQLGLEPTINMFVAHLIQIFDEVHRILKPEGTLWLNLADTYVGSWGSYGQRPETFKSSWHRRAAMPTDLLSPSAAFSELPRKCLAMVPERVTLAMLEHGWILRNKIIWHKPNHMPSSVKDRLTPSWEYLFFFVKSRKYYFDLDAIRVPHKTIPSARKASVTARPSPSIDGRRMPPHPGEPGAMHAKGKNPADFWTIPPETRSLGAMTGERGAVKVPGGAGWTGHPDGGMARIVRENDQRWLPSEGKNPGDAWAIPTAAVRRGHAHFAIYPDRLCEIPVKAGCPPGGIVLDPFIGSGTTAIVASRLGRRYIGIEVNPEYIDLANRRLAELDARGPPTKRTPPSHSKSLKGGSASRHQSDE